MFLNKFSLVECVTKLQKNIKYPAVRKMDLDIYDQNNKKRQQLRIARKLQKYMIPHIIIIRTKRKKKLYIHIIK